MRRRQQTIKELVNLIDPPNRMSCLFLLQEEKELFYRAPGSGHNHQAWPGGYLDHIVEVMNIAVDQYELLSFRRDLPFSLSDLLLVLFLHDIEKPWKYADPSVPNLATKDERHQFRCRKLIEYGITLTPDQANGMRYAEGELGDYSGKQRVMGPLACLAHVCDVISARLWFNHPLADNDSWQGAKRSNP